MKKNLLINYWDTYYKSNKKIKESSFARFVIKKIKEGIEWNLSMILIIFLPKF